MTRNKRRISYAKKAKEQRMKLYMLVVIVALLFTFSVASLADDGFHEITVIADSGDTLWSICETYKPEDMDLRLFISKVKYENNLKSSSLSVGQEIIIPLN